MSDAASIFMTLCSRRSRSSPCGEVSAVSLSCEARSSRNSCSARLSGIRVPPDRESDSWNLAYLPPDMAVRIAHVRNPTEDDRGPLPSNASVLARIRLQWRRSTRRCPTANARCLHRLSAHGRRDERRVPLGTLSMGRQFVIFDFRSIPAPVPHNFARVSKIDRYVWSRPCETFRHHRAARGFCR
jgi:hypothetical protein